MEGGGFADNAKIGRPLWNGVKAQDAPAHVERLVGVYLAHRLDAGESFHAFANRHEPEGLRVLAAAHEAGEA